MLANSRTGYREFFPLLLVFPLIQCGISQCQLSIYHAHSSAGGYSLTQLLDAVSIFKCQCQLALCPFRVICSYTLSALHQACVCPNLLAHLNCPREICSTHATR